MLGLVYLILFNRICCVVRGSQIQIQARSYQFCLGENLIDSLAIGLWAPIIDPFLWTGCLKETNETTPHYIHQLILAHKLPYLAKYRGQCLKYIKSNQPLNMLMNS